jgi:UDP-2-acetamido-3-amino-2,3-dideoxy-glucuronate N-acetyltransferase
LGRRTPCPREQLDTTVFMPVSANVVLGCEVKIVQPDLVNLYGCTVGEKTQTGPLVEIQENASIGKRCKISSHHFVCKGVTIEDDMFVGHEVMFINDLYPRATEDGRLQTEADCQVVPTRVRCGASIESGAVVLAGITIGSEALIGAGAVVTHDVPDHHIARGLPARLGRTLRRKPQDDLFATLARAKSSGLLTAPAPAQPPEPEKAMPDFWWAAGREQMHHGARHRALGLLAFLVGAAVFIPVDGVVRSAVRIALGHPSNRQRVRCNG